MKLLDKWFTNQTRKVARHTSRRSFLNQLGVLMVGTSTLPLLPMARAAGPEPAAPRPHIPGDPDPSKSNDTVWCMGKVGAVYNSTVSIVVGVATEEDR